NREAINLGLLISSLFLYCIAFVLMIISDFVKEREFAIFVIVIFSLLFNLACITLNVILLSFICFKRKARCVYALAWVSLGLGIPAGLIASIAWIIELALMNSGRSPDVFFALIFVSSVFLIVAAGLDGGIRRPSIYSSSVEIPTAVVQTHITNQQTMSVTNTNSDPKPNFNTIPYPNPHLYLNHYHNPNPNFNTHHDPNANPNFNTHHDPNANPNFNTNHDPNVNPNAHTNHDLNSNPSFNPNPIAQPLQ
ncbi:hypothetical protein BgiMline_034158, partial [Biomphalaria glabrata]